MKLSRPGFFLPTLGTVYTLVSFAYLFTAFRGGFGFMFLGDIAGGCLIMLPILTLFTLLIGWLVGCRVRWWAVLLLLLWMVAVGYVQLTIIAEASSSV